MATVPSFRTWVTGELVTASFMNTNIRDAGNFLTAIPVFQGRQTVAQSIPNSAGTGVTLDTEDIDSDNGHSTVSNTQLYTVATAGWWRYLGGGSLAANATGSRFTWIGKNGAGALPASATTALASAALVPEMTVKNGIVSCIVGDTLQVVLFQSSGGALNTVIAGVEAQPSMTLHWLRT